MTQPPMVDVSAKPAAPTGSDAAGPIRKTVATVASVMGLSYLWIVIGGSVVMQYARVIEPPLDWLRWEALLGIAVIVVALASRRLRRPAIVFGILIGIWMGAGALSSWRLTGSVDSRSVMLGLVCAGLFFGVAATKPSWAGWSIFAIGTAYVLIHLIVYYKSYYSLGAAFPRSTWWWSRSTWRAESLSSLKDWQGGRHFVALPYPDGRIDRVIALVRDVPNLKTWSGFNAFAFRGLTGSANQTGNFLAPFLAFVIPFAAHRWRAQFADHRVSIALGRILMAAIILVPGLFLLYVLDARAALAGVLASLLVLLVPLKWSRNAPVAALAAIVLPLVTLVPFILSRTQGISWTLRRCVWNEQWLPAVKASPIWGIGPPGRFDNTCFNGWVHAHNEVFQAWSLGGLTGLMAAVATIAGLAWMAVRYSDRDDRVLLAVLTSCLVLMGFEVLSSFNSNWVHMGIAWVIAIAARSLTLMVAPATTRATPTDSA